MPALVVDSRASMHMVSKRDLNSAEPWGLRRIRRRWWRPMARCKQEKKPQYLSKNWTFSWQWCFSKKHPQFFHLGRSARIMGIPTTGPVVKNQISQTLQKNQLQNSELRTTRCPWSVDEFLYFIFTCFLNIFIAGYCDQHGKSSNRKKWNYVWGVTVKPVAWVSRNRKHK